MSKVLKFVGILGFTAACSGLFTLSAHANDGDYQGATNYESAALGDAESGYVRPVTYRRYSSRRFSSNGFRQGSKSFNHRGFSNRRFSRSSRYNGYRRYRNGNRYYNRSCNRSYNRGYRSSRSYGRSY